MDRHDIFFRYNTGWMSGIAYDNRLNTFGKKYVKKINRSRVLKKQETGILHFECTFINMGS